MLSDDVDGFIFVFPSVFAVAKGVDVGGYVVYPVALFNGVSARWLILLDMIADLVHVGNLGLFCLSFGLGLCNCCGLEL